MFQRPLHSKGSAVACHIRDSDSINGFCVKRERRERGRWGGGGGGGGGGERDGLVNQQLTDITVRKFSTVTYHTFQSLELKVGLVIHSC